MTPRVVTESDWRHFESPILDRFVALRNAYIMSIKEIFAIGPKATPGSVICHLVRFLADTLWQASVHGDPSLHHIRRLRPDRPSSVIVKQLINYDGYFGFSGNPEEVPQSLYTHFYTALEKTTQYWQHLTPMKELAFEGFLTERLAKMVWGSNMMANAGADWPVTWEICRKLFGGQPLGYFIPTASFVHGIASHLRASKLPGDFASIMRAYQEVVAHARAAKYLITKHVVESRPIDITIIQQTHFILSQQSHYILRFPGPQEENAEVFFPRPHGPNPFDTEDAPQKERDLDQEPVMASSPWRDRYDECGGVNPRDIPAYMDQLILNMGLYFRMAQQTKVFDPFQYIAESIHIFATIRPFRDANGRMCRLLLNTLLLRLTGAFASLGSDPREFEQIGQLMASRLMPPAMTTDQHIQQLALLLLKKANKHLDMLNELFRSAQSFANAPVI